MFKKILVPLDGSELAESALPHAEALARASGAHLVLVRAALVRTFPGVDPTEGEIRVVEEAERYLADMAARLAGEGFEVETGVPYGDAPAEILKEVKLRHADLVVMATHGRSGLGRWVYGSVAEGVLAHSPVPVLLVRAWQAAERERVAGGLGRLLVPLDGSLFAEDALPLATRLAQVLGGELVLLQAVAAPGAPVADGLAAGVDFDPEAATAEAKAYLEATAARIKLEPGKVRHEVRLGLPADAIAQGCRELGVGMVVMASHRRTGLSRMFLGSVADTLLRHGDAPLLLVRTGEEPAVLKELVHAEEDEGPGGTTVTVALQQDEIILIRSALRTLGQTVSRHEHLHGRISRLLARLPNGELAAAEGAQAEEGGREKAKE